jgi:hypothetical protein
MVIRRTIEIPISSNEQEEKVIAVLIRNDIPHTIMLVSEDDASH